MRPRAHLAPLLTFGLVAACGPEDARHVRVELDLAADDCDTAACVEHLTGTGIVVSARDPETSSELATRADQSMLYAELVARSGALVMVEMAWGGASAPRVRYREVEDGTLLFSGQISRVSLDLPEPGASWIQPGTFAFTAEPGPKIPRPAHARVITNGRVRPLETDRVTVTEVENGDPYGGAPSTQVIVVIDGETRYDEYSGCDAPDRTVIGTPPSTSPSTGDPSTGDPSSGDPSSGDPGPGDPTGSEDPTTTDPPTSPGTSPPTHTTVVADDTSGCDDAETSSSSSDGCGSSSSSSSSSDGCGGDTSSSSSSSDGCEGDASSSSSSSSGCEGDTSSSSSDGCDSSSSSSSSSGCSSCEGDAYAATSPQTRTSALAPTRRGPSRAASGIFRLVWPIALVGAWNRRLRYRAARGGVVAPPVTRRDDATTTTVRAKTS